MDELRALQKLTGLVFGHYVEGAPGYEYFRKKVSANARQESIVSHLHEEWMHDLMRLIARKERFDEAEAAAAWSRIETNHDAAMLLANYVSDAYREPLGERRRMLQHAALGLFDMALDLDQLVQVWRALHDLSPRDVQALYGFWLLRNSAGPEPFGRGSPGAARARLAEEHQLDALLASRAVSIRAVGEGFGSGGTHDELSITRRGELILSGLRTYLDLEQLPFVIRGHEHRKSGRSREEATALFSNARAVDTFRKYQNRHFDRLAVQYSSPHVDGGALISGCAHLIVYGMSADDRNALPTAQPRNIQTGHQAPDELWLESAGDPVVLCGPHDLLRYLAYDLFAFWG